MTSDLRIKIAESLGWTDMDLISGFLQGVPPEGHIDEPTEQIPDFDTDANAALQLVEVLAKELWWCVLGNGLDLTWECEFERPPTPDSHPDNIGSRRGETLEIHYGSADTLPEAICLAYCAVKSIQTK